MKFILPFSKKQFDNFMRKLIRVVKWSLLTVLPTGSIYYTLDAIKSGDEVGILIMTLLTGYIFIMTWGMQIYFWRSDKKIQFKGEEN